MISGDLCFLDVKYQAPQVKCHKLFYMLHNKRSLAADSLKSPS